MSRISPPRDTAAVDLSTNDYASSAGFNAVYVGTSGNLTIVKLDGTTQLYKNIAGGLYHPIQGKGILRSGTTAADLIVALS